jgi:hypothetical protein
VRWCGTIVQHPHLKDISLPSLKVGQRRRLLLERGETPQYHEAREKDRRGNWLFADPTEYTVKQGAVMELENRAHVLVNDDSGLIFEPGSRLVLNDRSRIVVAKGATLVIPDGAEVSMGKGARIVRK